MADYLITGASSGIGREMARQLCMAGHVVYGLARREEKLAALAEEFGENFRPFVCDVTDKKLVRDVCDSLPTVPNVVILNAGVGDFDPRSHFDLAVHERTFATNYFGPIYVIDALFGKMAERGSGKFVAISSLAAFRGMPQGAAYGGSKAALSVAVESMRLTYRELGLEFVTVHPGFVETPMTAVNKFKMPFLWTAEKAARFIIDGIATGKPVINFPIPMRLVLTVAQLMPARLYGKIVK
jgi:short-subunit dehydrogenase